MPATDSFFRDLKKTHVVFAGSSLLLLFTTLWMLHDDHNDEWRTWQQKWDMLESARLQTAASGEIDLVLQKTSDLKTQIADAKKTLDKKQAKVAGQEAAVAGKLDAVKVQLRKTKPLRTERDVARANYDLAVRDSHLIKDSTVRATSLKNALQAFTVARQTVDTEERTLRALQDQAKASQAVLVDLRGTEADEIKELGALQAALDLTNESRDLIHPESSFRRFKRWLMEQPVIDGFNSHHRVIQDWLPGQRITLGMTQTARFDRCRTCHLAIGRVLAGNIEEFPHGDVEIDADPRTWVKAGKFPHPFATHPRPDVYLTASSPHPLTEFGCTSCHEGQGSGTSFNHAAHGANHPAEQEEWFNEYGFAPNHFWEYPMFPQRLREASCLKCHHSVVELGINPKYGATAKKLYRGWELVNSFGCFGCHEITGFDGGKPIGPDLRLEPANAGALTAALATAEKNMATARAALENSGDDQATRQRADAALVSATTARNEATKAIKEASGVAHPGRMRKVGPSLKHVAQKTTSAWLNAWITEPKKFRPNTRMPQFFGLSNQDDAHGENFSPVEIAAVAHYLVTRSTDAPLDRPAEGYKPDITRGKLAFSQRGCLACHSHDAVPDPDKKLSATFGPNLSQIHLKIRHDADKAPNDPTDSGFRWLYTWLRKPQQHHPRTRMPDLFLDPDKDSDPAADIAAFLLSKQPGSYPVVNMDKGFKENLDELVTLYMGKVVGERRAEDIVKKKLAYPETDPEKIAGDEKELVGKTISDEMKLAYVGRRTISRYGCYGCHDITGFETARPIGTKLEDWGRKDRTKLAVEHIEDFLHHNQDRVASHDGHPVSTRHRVDEAMKKARAESDTADVFADEAEAHRETGAAFFYQSLMHHGREGFLWQKLRDPRSYDYKKTETKGYDERLRMPRFTFDPDPKKNEDAIEAVATFILGLVAEPPPTKYVYTPDQRSADRIEGERLLRKYNCVGCHMLELPEIRVQTTLEGIPAAELAASDHEAGRDLLLRIQPPRQVTLSANAKGKFAYSFHGLSVTRPDPAETDLDPEEREYAFNLWEPLTLNWTVPTKKGKPQSTSRTLLPSEKILTAEPDLLGEKPARGGRFAEWLVADLFARSNRQPEDRDLSWQASPPPLAGEGRKAQTPWLYHFLKNPTRIRYTTVLRMPRFNLDDSEARSLANYFAAADGAPYPYQPIPQKEDEYLAERNREFEAFERPHDYLTESWQLLNGNLCIKCHSLGGRTFKFNPNEKPKPIRGPNLEAVSQRLQPDWVQIWLYNPKWFTPYPSMPQPFAKNQKTSVQHFAGNGSAQATAVRDALMNYFRLLERDGKIVPPQPAPAAPGGNAQP